MLLSRRGWLRLLLPTILALAVVPITWIAVQELDAPDPTVVAGRVLWLDGTPAQAYLTLFRKPSGHLIDRVGLRTRTDADGTFRFEGLKPGERDLGVYAAVDLRRGREVPGWPTWLETRAGMQDLCFQFRRIDPVRGQVVGPDGEPRHWFFVRAKHEGEYWNMEGEVYGTFTHEDGSFENRAFEGMTVDLEVRTQLGDGTQMRFSDPIARVEGVLAGRDDVVIRVGR